MLLKSLSDLGCNQDKKKLNKALCSRYKKFNKRHYFNVVFNIHYKLKFI